MNTGVNILQEMGIPDHLTCLLRNLYAGQEVTVRTGHGTTDWLQIGKGARQGCMLSPCLFNFYAEYIMWNVRLEEAQAGIKRAWEAWCAAGLGVAKSQTWPSDWTELNIGVHVSFWIMVFSRFIRTYCIAQGTQLNALQWHKWERNPQTTADSLWCTAETSRALWSNYTPYKK